MQDVEPFSRPQEAREEMTKDTLTLALEGDVPLDDFSKAIQRFTGLVHALSEEISSEVNVEWVIQELQSGSAIATVQGICDTEGIVSQIVDAYAEVGDALARGENIPFSHSVRTEASRLTDILNGRISYIRFETADRDVLITGRTTADRRPHPIKYSFGTIKGTVQMLTMRRGLKFTLYDVLFDKAVSCYLREGQEEMMRNAWGKRAVVSGRIGREPEHGHPVVVREVTGIRILKDVAPGSYTRAKGVIPWREGDESAAVTIKKLWEGEKPLSHSGRRIPNA